MLGMRSDVTGATSIEYGLFAASIGLALLFGMNTVGKHMKIAFAQVLGGAAVSVEARDTSIEADVVHTGSIRR